MTATMRLAMRACPHCGRSMTHTGSLEAQGNLYVYWTCRDCPKAPDKSRSNYMEYEVTLP